MSNLMTIAEFCLRVGITYGRYKYLVKYGVIPAGRGGQLSEGDVFRVRVIQWHSEQSRDISVAKIALTVDSIKHWPEDLSDQCFMRPFDGGPAFVAHSRQVRGNCCITYLCNVRRPGIPPLFDRRV